MEFMRFAALVLVLLAGCKEGSEAPEPVQPVQSQPVVILLAMDSQNTLYGTSMGNVPKDLDAAGFKLMSFDLPCHGSDAEQLPPLDCWRRRLEAGDVDLFVRFCRNLSASLDREQIKRAYIVGQSRGAYVGATCAAMDSRITKLAMLIPVTDLSRLREFAGFENPPPLPSVYIPTYIRIGNDDQRVGTDAAISYGKSISAKIEVINVPGHDPQDDGATVRWLTDQR
jgi:pimeloyl-ACP methyl ester carboxylesterase